MSDIGYFFPLDDLRFAVETARRFPTKEKIGN